MTLAPSPTLALSAGVPVLMDMLTYRRPAWSRSEEDFIKKFIGPLNPHRDDFGNLWVEVGEDPIIMWSSHTDSVHHTAGRQEIKLDNGMVSLLDPKGERPGNVKSNCLGADCAAGVWLMVEMIRAQVPGLYIFHRDEEVGGRGSSWIAKNHADMLDGIKFAIAFDRKGYSSVITHQGGRTASDAFAWSLANILGGTFVPDDTGLFTDTASYSHLLPECSNVSVGYHSAHGPKESLDLAFIVRLRDTLLAADFSSLVCEREPGEDDLDGWPKFAPWGDYSLDQERWSRSYGSETLETFVRENPAIVTDYLEQCGFTLADLQDHARAFL